MNQDVGKIIPNNYYQTLVTAFNELISIANIQDEQTIIAPPKSPTLKSILDQIDQIDSTLISDKKSNEIIEQKKAELIEFSQHPDLISTSFYTQAVIEAMKTKKVKNETINCAYAHMMQGFPSLKQEQELVKQCKLQSYQIAQEQEFRNIKSITPNVYQLHKMEQISQFSENHFSIHITIYHPFTNKKQQIIVVSPNSTLMEIMQEIDCPVEQAEKLFYKNEINNFDKPKLNFGNDDQKIGEVTIELCKQYTYIHLNQCKHRIYINEIRSLMKGEDNSIKTVFKAPLKIKNCDGCGRSAQLFRIQDPLIPGTSPAFLCTFCNQQLHQGDIEGSLPYFCD